MAALAKEPALPEIDIAGALEIEVDEIISDCGGNARAAVRALVTLAYAQEAECATLRAAVSHGFARGLLVLDGEGAKDGAAK